MESFPNIFAVHTLSSDIGKLVRFLQQKGILATRYTCPKCGGGMKLAPRKDIGDGLTWKCCKKQLHKILVQRTLRKGSWFAFSKMSLSRVFDLTYIWVAQLSQKNMKVLVDGSISSATVTDWYSFCREICIGTLLNRPQTQIGGSGHVVEIDESKLAKRMYTRGNHVEGHWVIGGVDRETKECFLVTVEDRTRGTLLGVLRDNVLPGTTICSDPWEACGSLEDEGYLHVSVKRSESFKRSLPLKIRNKEMLGSHLAEYVYRKWRFHNKSMEERFHAYLDDIAAVYPPATSDELDSSSPEQAGTSENSC
ncbi:hypothetical protein ANN_27396 [Periplaneta americana]|uniref:ISXO2-like transposase domain-containing protein n=1 Tax=Periplaneta americana TaxID=6978 RepID=A0ABQ8RVM9_PERAM|nr:hypothetical protein ANN_27396 [Periplaneta americana]